MFVSPMLLETSSEPFDSPNHIFEPKIDGHRLILSRVGGQTRLYTRHRTDCTRQYPELQHIDVDDIILDGEVACTDPATGKIDFESVMERFALRKIDKIRFAAARAQVSYIVFDVLRYRGQDLRRQPLMKRKEILAGLHIGNPQIAIIPYIEREGCRLFDQIRAEQMEGIVAKRKGSVYVGRRSVDWQKVINWSYADIYLTGYKKAEFGWLAAVMTERGLRPAGLIEYGTNAAQRARFNAEGKPHKTGEDKNFVYLEPRLQARVKMRNWTRRGMLRDPVFVDFLY